MRRTGSPPVEGDVPQTELISEPILLIDVGWKVKSGSITRSLYGPLQASVIFFGFVVALRVRSGAAMVNNEQEHITKYTVSDHLLCARCRRAGPFWYDVITSTVFVFFSTLDAGLSLHRFRRRT
ncbi:hypothetical protein KC325_g249 [Hortaea werneckii]|nr:hypothetical protein KC325_g249 [Hortaea werneckii]